MIFNRFTGCITKTCKIPEHEKVDYYALHDNWYPVFHPQTHKYMGFIDYEDKFVTKEDDIIKLVLFKVRSSHYEYM